MIIFFTINDKKMILSHEQPCINEAKLQKEDGYSLKYICVENNAWFL